MRHQTITIAIPDHEQWRKGDHIPTDSAFSRVGIEVVDAEEPVDVARRITVDLSISFDEWPGSTWNADNLARATRVWLQARNSPLASPLTHNVEVVVHGSQTFTP